MHMLSSVDTSLGQSALFGLALSRAALLGVGWRFGSSYHKVHTYLLERLAYSQFEFVYFNKVYPNIADI